CPLESKRKRSSGKGLLKLGLGKAEAKPSTSSISWAATVIKSYLKGSLVDRDRFIKEVFRPIIPSYPPGSPELPGNASALRLALFTLMLLDGVTGFVRPAGKCASATMSFVVLASAMRALRY